MAKTELDNIQVELGLTVTAEFVPYSQSRSFKPDAKLSERNLNWKVSLYRWPDGYMKGKERLVLTTDYSAGIAHCPRYKQKLSGGFTIEEADLLTFETEHGKRASDRGGLGLYGREPIAPDTLDVLYSLASDADVLNYSSFEDWAESLGYETDSRKAESVYRACTEIALKLRNGLGEDGLRKLQDAAQDY